MDLVKLNNRCFPLGFHDSLHHLPVVRQCVTASAFGLRFQGTSGALVVMSDLTAAWQAAVALCHGSYSVFIHQRSTWADAAYESTSPSVSIVSGMPTSLWQSRKLHRR